MTGLITPERLPEWVPGRLLLDSAGLGWHQVSLRAYHYLGQDVIVPAMRDFMLVSYREGATPMQRRFEGRWSRDTLGPGASSLLTRAQRASWNWEAPIDVVHLYLTPGLMAGVASEVMDCHVSEVALADVLRTDDPVISRTVEMIASETGSGGLGGPLYVESLSRALIVHLLRRYASISRREPKTAGLSPGQMRRIRDYILANLAEPMDLTGLSGQIGLTPCLFARQFRESFGRPPYAWVMEQRLAKARVLLAETMLPIKEIAALCGFADQAHLTRMFARECGVTPAAFRRSLQ